MPRQIQLFTVFLASPSGLEPERLRVRSAASELNRTLGRAIGSFIEVVGWEEVPSSAGDDPQDVINRYIGSDYDIFLGLMGADIGSPTARAASGTIEEYGRALKRFIADRQTVQLMFYFKDSRTLHEEGLELSPRVMEFRTRVRDHVLDKTFRDPDDLEGQTRHDLAQVVRAWERRTGSETDLDGDDA